VLNKKAMQKRLQTLAAMDKIKQMCAIIADAGHYEEAQEIICLIGKLEGKLLVKCSILASLVEVALNGEKANTGLWKVKLSLKN
jgi:hypothetical protein